MNLHPEHLCGGIACRVFPTSIAWTSSWRRSSACHRRSGAHRIDYYNMCAISDYELLHRQCTQIVEQRWQEISTRLCDKYVAAIAITKSRFIDQQRAQLRVIYEENTSAADLFPQSLACQLQRTQVPSGGIPTPRHVAPSDRRISKRRTT